MTDLASLDTDELARTAELHIGDIRSSLEKIAELTDHLVDRDALVIVLADLRDVLTGKQSLASRVLGEVEAQLLSECNEKTFDTPFGRVEVKRSTGWRGTKWDDLLPVLAQKARERRFLNTDAGQVEGEAEAAIRTLRECVSMSGIKTTGLKALDLAPDEYATPNDQGYSIKLPPRSAA